MGAGAYGKKRPSPKKKNQPRARWAFKSGVSLGSYSKLWKQDARSEQRKSFETFIIDSQKSTTIYDFNIFFNILALLAENDTVPGKYFRFRDFRFEMRIETF